MSDETVNKPLARCPHCGEELAEAEVEHEEEDGSKRARLNNDETYAAFLNSIEAGNSITGAAAEAGIHRAVVYRWWHRGEDQKRRRVQGKYRRFVEDVEAAQERMKARLVNIVAVGVEDDPQLALEVLSRRDPMNWAPKAAEAINDYKARCFEAIFEEFVHEQEIIERFIASFGRVDAPQPVREVQANKFIEAQVVRQQAQADEGGAGPAPVRDGAKPNV